MKRKLLAVTLAAVMSLAVQAPAFAATDDPNMTAYETQYTTTVNSGTADTVYLMAVPANSSYVAMTFDTEADAAAVAGTNYYGNTSYPSALDGVTKTWQMTNNQEGSLKDKTIVNEYGTYVVKSLTFDGHEPLTNYTDANYNYFGWQYRVYRGSQKLAISELTGADECALQNGDTVIWKYGQYGVVSFPSTL